MRLTNKILARSCKQARFDKPANNSWLCSQMLEFMHSQDAIGLAANQIGRDVRLFVMSVSGVTRCCFNPEITDSGSNTAKMAEGCLSFKGKQCILQRPDVITVRYQDHSGVWIQDRLIGLESRCFQHELDHLNGVTMWDRQKEQHAEQSGN
jgi:peptide deformylase